MDAVRMLLDDHERVRRLFQEYQQSAGSDGARAATAAQQILMELEIHSKLEEEIFYPAYRTKAEADGKELVAEAYEEHAEVDRMVAELKSMSPGTREYNAKMQTLIDNVEHHVQEEESEMLPDAQEVLGNQTDRLGQEMMQRKQQMMAQMGSTMGGSMGAR